MVIVITFIANVYWARSVRHILAKHLTSVIWFNLHKMSVRGLSSLVLSIRTQGLMDIKLSVQSLPAKKKKNVANPWFKLRYRWFSSLTQVQIFGSQWGCTWKLHLSNSWKTTFFLNSFARYGQALDLKMKIRRRHHLFLLTVEILLFWADFERPSITSSNRDGLIHLSVAQNRSWSSKKKQKL